MDTILLDIADRIEGQADALVRYAESEGYTTKGVASVFHIQASHFRELATEIRSAISDPYDGVQTPEEADFDPAELADFDECLQCENPTAHGVLCDECFAAEIDRDRT